MTTDYVTEKKARALLWPDERLVFIRGGWCERYDSDTGKEWPVRGGSHNLDGLGWEYDNFRPYFGLRYVYTRARHENPLTLARLGAPGADEVGHVTVIQVATHIYPEYGQVVVGWFRAATAYATWQRRPYAKREKCAFKAPENLAHCLDVEDRERPEFNVPKGKPGQMGQSQVRYASDSAGRLRVNRWMSTILEAIRDYEGDKRVRR